MKTFLIRALLISAALPLLGMAQNKSETVITGTMTGTAPVPSGTPASNASPAPTPGSGDGLHSGGGGRSGGQVVAPGK